MNDMCGIRTSTGVGAGNGYRETGASGKGARRVLPFQGGEGSWGPSSQGVALGCRVIAPLARTPLGAVVCRLRRVSGTVAMRFVLNLETPNGTGVIGYFNALEEDRNL